MTSQEEILTAINKVSQDIFNSTKNGQIRVEVVGPKKLEMIRKYYGKYFIEVKNVAD